MPEDQKPWMIRDVPEATRRQVKVYAAQHDLTMGKALEALVNLALSSSPSSSPRPQRPKLKDLMTANGEHISPIAAMLAERIAEDVATFDPDLTPEQLQEVMQQLAVLPSGAREK